MLQRGMNYRLKPGYSIILMSVRKGAPYKDQWHEDLGLLEYEGHDEPRREGIEPKKINQPLQSGKGTFTENGKFYEAAMAYKKGKGNAEIVQVYEKISQGVWCDQGRYELIDAKIVKDGTRNVFRFFLKLSVSPKTGQLIKVELFSGILGQRPRKGTRNNDTETKIYSGIQSPCGTGGSA